MHSRVFGFVLLLVSLAAPSEMAAAEKVLIPVFLGERNESGFGFAPGVNGWVTSAFVVSPSTEPVFGGGVSFSVHCDIPEGCPMSSVPPGQVGQIFAPVSAAGLILDVPTSEHVSVAAWASRWPSGSPGPGTQLPIARERDFVSRPLRFLAVPIGIGARDHTVRLHLRVYSLVKEPVRVRVEMQYFFTVAGPVHETYEVDLNAIQPPGPSRFAFIDLVAQFPWSGAHTTWENLTVVPLPAADGSVPAIWAFVSVTTSTNEIRIVPPA